MSNPYSPKPEAAYQRQYRATNAEAIRRKNLRRLYGVTPEEIDALREIQGYCCAICKRHEADLPENTSGRKPLDGRPVATAPKLVLDHCHQGHGNRQLICQRCNRLVGAGNDDPALFRAVAKYLDAHGCDH